MEALRRVAEFLGLPCATIRSSSLTPSEKCLGLVVDVADLATHLETPNQAILSEAIAARGEPVLFLVTSADPRTTTLLRHLTGQVVHGLSRRERASRIAFAGNAAAVCKELSGMCFGRTSAPIVEMVAAEGPVTTPLMHLDEGVAFLTWNAGPSPRFAWSTPTVMEIQKPLSSEGDFEGALDAILPALMFFRSQFPQLCWQNPDRTAGFVIDDPLLEPHYGFISFPALLASARRHSYHVSLAFIPWNSWRTKTRHVRLFKEHADVFSLCVHGCDHNNNEYGSPNLELLVQKNQIALERMRRHEARTGLPFAPLMVCPQEQCSLEAWRSFATTPGMLGMVNTGCLARNVTNTQVCAQDLLLPAQDALFGLPVFKRHYAGSMAPFALALFLGRPAVLVEHHEYFRQGLAGIETFAADLRRICPAVRWPSLNDLATTTHMRRLNSSSGAEVRFFTNEFTLFVDDGAPPTHLLYKRIHDASAVQRVLVDGVEVPYRIETGILTFDVSTPSPGARKISVQTKAPVSPKVYSYGLRNQSNVAIRRVFSEFRDNWLAKSPAATSVAKRLASAMRLTGSSVRRRTSASRSDNSQHGRTNCRD